MKFSQLFMKSNISTVGEHCKAFVPAALPPKPPLTLNPALNDLLQQTLLLPDTSLFLYMYIGKEAVLPSQIEGTQSSLSDLLLFEIEETPGVPLDDVQEVSNYVAAMDHGLKRIREGFPFSLRLIKEIHSILLSKGRGDSKSPGQFRTSQNWIGGTRPGNATFVPPPPENLWECMGDLERFLNNQPEPVSTIIKAALAHIQFETIHPFLDGNGRLGRLLITLLLCAEGVLKEPMLYLSLYFKTHRQRYYDLLQIVRTDGDWEQWLEFFLTAVNETSTQAVNTATILTKIAQEDRDKIQSAGRIANSAMRVHYALLQKPIIRCLPACHQTS